MSLNGDWILRQDEPEGGDGMLEMAHPHGRFSSHRLEQTRALVGASGKPKR
jgi:hypothetical protein